MEFFSVIKFDYPRFKSKNYLFSISNIKHIFNGKKNLNQVIVIVKT